MNPIKVVSDLMVLNVKNKFISITNAHFSAKVCVILLHICSKIHITKSALIINLIVAPCIFRRITSIYQPTNSHIISYKTLLKHFKTIRHVSILCVLDRASS